MFWSKFYAFLSILSWSFGRLEQPPISGKLTLEMSLIVLDSVWYCKGMKAMKLGVISLAILGLPPIRSSIHKWKRSLFLSQRSSLSSTALLNLCIWSIMGWQPIAVWRYSSCLDKIRQLMPRRLQWYRLLLGPLAYLYATCSSKKESKLLDWLLHLSWKQWKASAIWQLTTQIKSSLKTSSVRIPLTITSTTSEKICSIWSYWQFHRMVRLLCAEPSLTTTAMRAEA